MNNQLFSLMRTTSRDDIESINKGLKFQLRHGLIMMFIAGAMSAGAVTLGDVSREDVLAEGLDVMEVVLSEYAFGPVPVVTSGAPQWLESAGPSGEPLVMLARMIDGTVNMDVKVDNNGEVTFYLSPWDWKNNIEGKDRISQYYVSAETFGFIIPANFTGTGYKYFVTPPTLTDGEWFMKGKVTENAYGGLHLEMPAPFLVYTFDSRTARLVSKYKHHGFYMDSYRPNAFVTGRYTNHLRRSYQDDEGYRARFDLNADGTLSILNWGNLGLSATADGDKGYTTAPWHGRWTLGSGDGYGTVTIDVAQAGWASCDSAKVALPQYLGHRSAETGNLEAVKGRISDLTNCRHTAGSDNSQWVTDGGTLRTVANLTVDFEAMDLVVPGVSAIHPACTDDVVRSYPASHTAIADVDITHNPGALNVSAFYIVPPMWNDPRQYLVIDGSLTVAGAPAHVGGYELCIIPGQYTDATSPDFAHADGHPLAYTTGAIADISTVQPLAIDDTNSDDAITTYTFHHRIATADLPAPDPERKYTLFVRTNYDPTTGLAPTYNALTVPPVPTAVTDPTINPAATLDDAATPATYYTLDGRPIPAPTYSNVSSTSTYSSSVSIPTSIFNTRTTPTILIRRQGSTTTKILTR